MTHKDLPVVSFTNADEFYSWLSKHHDTEKAFWLRYYKKGSQKPTIVHTDAVDVALCWGWIDGLANAYDAESYLVRFTPRRAKSIWSKINVEKVARLIAEKKMQPQGMVHVETAWKYYQTLNKAQLFSIGFKLATAKTAETRERRMQKLFEQLKAEQKIV